jgi:poly(3-hydroxybutyrate) depolymerase
MKKKFFSGVCFMVAAFTALALIACGGGDSTPATPEAGLPVVTKSITVNGVARTYSVYVPSTMAALLESDARQVPIIFSFHDQGQTGEDNAKATRWAEVAEAKGFVVAFPSALNGTWNTTPTAAASATGTDELAFVKAVWTLFQQAPSTPGGLNLSSGNPVYLTGIGTGAAIAQQLAMVGSNLSSMQVISAVAGIQGTAPAAIFSLPAGATPAGASLPVTTTSVWLIRNSTATPTETQQLNYWKTLNAVATTPTTTSDSAFDTTTYSNAVNIRQEVRLSTFKTPAISGQALSEKIWNEMFSKVCRFLDDTRVNGSLHPWESISQMGLTEESNTFSAAAGGKQRWLTYKPSNYAALTAGGAKIPVVFSLHGRKGSARWQAMMTQWHKVAEAKGFLMIYPQGPLATWDCSLSKDPAAINPDVQYFLELLTYLKTKYAIDPTRVYLNGTSMGSFFANVIGVQYPAIFAALAPCYSGHLSTDQYTNYAQYPTMRVDIPMPVWQCHGGDEPASAFPGNQEAARKFWRETVNHYAAAATEDAAVPTRTEIRTDTAGRKVINIFEGGLADYRWQVTDYVPHFWNLPDQAEQMWDDMFSHYVRNANGTLTKK